MADLREEGQRREKAPMPGEQGRSEEEEEEAQRRAASSPNATLGSLLGGPV